MDFLRGFGRIHHKHLNSIDRLEKLSRACGRRPGLVDVAEGDLCWWVDGRDVTAVMMHPAAMTKLPELPAVMERIAHGTVIQLEDILDSRFSEVPFVIELKAGRGNTRVALEHVLGLVEEHAHGRYWVDSFSPALLAEVKRISPATPTSLHTRLGVYGTLVIKTAFEPVQVQLAALE